METSINSILDSYDNSDLDHICKIVNFCKTHYDNKIIEQNLSPYFINLKKKADEYVYYFAKIQSNKNNKNDKDDILCACDELRNFINSIRHYEDDSVHTESEKEIIKNNIIIEKLTKKFSSDKNTNENIDEDLDEDDNEDPNTYINDIFLEVIIKKIYVLNYELKYIKFDYDSRLRVPDIILEKSETIFCNNKIIFLDNGAHTEYARDIYNIFNFKKLNLYEFSKFLCYLFDTDYESHPKYYTGCNDPDENYIVCNIDNIDNHNTDDHNIDDTNDTVNIHDMDDIVNYCEEYNKNNNFDYIYDIIKEFDRIVEPDQIENLIDVLNLYLKKKLFIVNNLPIDEIYFDFFIDKIKNINYNVHTSNLFKDDICKIISFDIFFGINMTISCVSFEGISVDTREYHTQYIKNIYVDNEIVIYQHGSTSYLNDIYNQIYSYNNTFQNVFAFHSFICHLFNLQSSLHL